MDKSGNSSVNELKIHTREIKTFWFPLSYSCSFHPCRIEGVEVLIRYLSSTSGQ